MAHFRVLHHQLTRALEKYRPTAQAQHGVQSRKPKLTWPYLGNAPQHARVPPTDLPLPGPKHKSCSGQTHGVNFLGPSSYADLGTSPDNAGATSSASTAGDQWTYPFLPSRWLANKVSFYLAYLPFLWRLLWWSHKTNHLPVKWVQKESPSNSEPMSWHGCYAKMFKPNPMVWQHLLHLCRFCFKFLYTLTCWLMQDNICYVYM